MKTRVCLALLVLSFTLCIFAFQACEGDKVEEANLNLGTSGNPCRADGTCNEGLECVSNICLVVSAPDPETPVVSITAPTEGAVISVTPFKITVDASAKAGIALVKFFDGDTMLGEDLDAADGWSFEWKPTFANDGAHKFKAKAYDTAELSAESAIVNATVKFPSFAKTFGGKYAAPSFYAIAPTPDGGYIGAGYTYSFGAGSDDVWVLKLDAGGNATWQKTFEGKSYDSANAISPTPDGGYLVAGSTSSFGAGGHDAWVLKLDAGGNATWQKTFGGTSDDSANAIAPTPDGGYIVAGETGSFGAGGYDAWVLKLDVGGNATWQKTFGGKLGDYAKAIAPTPDGGYIVAGETFSFGAGNCDVWVLKLDAGGNASWQKTFGGKSYDSANAISPTPDGGYIVASETYSFGVEYLDAWVLKLDAGGNAIWQKMFGGKSSDYARTTAPTPDGGYIVAGYTDSFGAGIWNAWVLKLDSNGKVVWQKTFGGTSCDFANATAPTPDGGYIVAGYNSSFGAGDYDAWVLKLKPDGTIDASCPEGMGKDSQATVLETSATGSKTNATVTQTTVTPATSNAAAIDSTATSVEQCKN